MGTAGSFDIATVTDLFLLEYLYKTEYNLETSKGTTFNKVGDDLWCYDPEGLIRKAYIEKCGLAINLSKTKSATRNNLCGEFVSRNINYGQDVSRISANICRAVDKNIIDLPQLCSHLQERGYQSTLNVSEILEQNKIKGRHRKFLIRSFLILCHLHPNRTKLLRLSLMEHCYDEIHKDNILSIIETFGVKSISDTFNSYQVIKLIAEIGDKCALVFDSAGEFDSSDILMGRSDPDKL